MAYDAARQELILYGTTAIESGVSETWAWKNEGWTQLHPVSSPPPRTSAGMAYDAGTQTIVLFGGQSAGGGTGGLSPMQDTWTWDGTTWSLARPSSSPPPMVGPLMSEDPALGRLVMLTDTQQGGGPSQLTETWAWDGSTWDQLHPLASPPAPRFGGVMAYDAVMSQLVLFGQIVYIIGPQAGQPDTATWTFDGRSWTVHPSGQHPNGIEFAAMAYDDATKTVLHFGGGKAFDFFNDTWTWSGAGWRPLSPLASPSIRSMPVAAYDGADRQVVLYGGGVHTQNSGTAYYDTWSWDGLTWTLRQPSANNPSPDRLRAMVAAAGAHLAGQRPSSGISGVDAGYVSFQSQQTQSAGNQCVVYVARDYPDTWRYVDSVCAAGPGVFPIVGQPVKVQVSGCANVRDAPDFGRVVACLTNGTQVMIDDGPFYVNGKLWWHIQGRGFMVHDLLIAGS